MLSSMHSRIVFIESKPGGLVIDALASDGRALSMDAVVPASMWGFAAALTLGRWAEQGSQVTVDLFEKGGSRRVRLSDEDHLVMLDLTRPASLSPLSDREPAAPAPVEEAAKGG
jgi:hypothetical protein